MELSKEGRATVDGRIRVLVARRGAVVEKGIKLR
jgi:hypothetical protein